MKKINLMLALIVIIGAAVFSYKQNLFQSKNIFEENSKKSCYKEITQKEAYEFLSSKESLFIDTRSEQTYKISHIPGAINIPYGEKQALDESIINKLGNKNTIIVYGEDENIPKEKSIQTWEWCVSSKSTYQLLGGFIGWQNNNYPIDGIPVVDENEGCPATATVSEDEGTCSSGGGRNKTVDPYLVELAEKYPILKKSVYEK